MHTLNANLAAMLRRLAGSHGESPLAEVERILAAVFDADEIRFLDVRGRGFPAESRLSELLEQPFDISVRFRCTTNLETRTDEVDADFKSRFREATADGPKLSEEERYERFLYEFDRLENRHGFMWAGYIVRELLPRLGYSAEEAKLALDRMRVEGILKMTKVANPKNPEFPATGVLLNREHPRVRAILQHSAGGGNGAPTSPAAAAPPAPTEPEQTPSTK